MGTQCLVVGSAGWGSLQILQASKGASPVAVGELLRARRAEGPKRGAAELFPYSCWCTEYASGVGLLEGWVIFGSRFSLRCRLEFLRDFSSRFEELIPQGRRSPPPSWQHRSEMFGLVAAAWSLARRSELRKQRGPFSLSHCLYSSSRGRRRAVLPIGNPPPMQCFQERGPRAAVPRVSLRQRGCSFPLRHRRLPPPLTNSLLPPRRSTKSSSQQVCLLPPFRVPHADPVAAGPSLKVISSMSAGYDHVNTAALASRGIRLGTSASFSSLCSSTS